MPNDNSNSIYIIDGQKFVVNEDVTINEIQEIEKYNKRYSVSDDSSMAKLQFDDLNDYKSYIKLLVTPMSSDVDKDKIDFGKVSVKTAMRIVHDFFLSSMRQKLDMPNYLEQLTKSFQNELQKQNEPESSQ